MARFAYRQLTSHRDPNAIADARAQNLASDPILNRVIAQASAVRVVHASESTGSFEQLAGMLRDGSLGLRDLVLVDGHWTSFEDAGPFVDVVEPLIIRGNRAGWLKKVGLVGLGFIALIAYFWIQTVSS